MNGSGARPMSATDRERAAVETLQEWASEALSVREWEGRETGTAVVAANVDGSAILALLQDARGASGAAPSMLLMV